MADEDNYNITIPKEAVAAVMAAFREAFVEAMHAACAANGNRGGEWFDVLERTTLEKLKASEWEGASIDHEAIAMRTAVQAVSDIFNQFRAALPQADDGSS